MTTNCTDEDFLVSIQKQLCTKDFVTDPTPPLHERGMSAETHAADKAVAAPLPSRGLLFIHISASPWARKKTPRNLLDLVIISIFADVKKTPSQVLGMM